MARLQAVVAALGGQPLSVLASAAPELERLTGAAPATFELAEEAMLEDPNPNPDPNPKPDPNPDPNPNPHPNPNP